MIKLLTHNDLDGVGCYIAIGYFYDGVEVQYCSNTNVNDCVREALSKHTDYDKIYITDLSVNTQNELLINEINSSNPMKIVLIDHHKTAQHLDIYNWATVKVNTDDHLHCGTELVYEYLLEEFSNEFNDDLRHITSSLGRFVELVRRYDTWLWKTKYNDTKPKIINDLFTIYGIDDFVIDINNKLFPNEEEELIDEQDELVLKVEQKRIDRYIKKKEKELTKTSVTIQGKVYAIGFVFADSYISELGNTLSTNNCELDFICIINNTVSLRTIHDNVDLSEIAKLYGGGGHQKAAGFTFNKNLLSDIIPYVFNK